MQCRFDVDAARDLRVRVLSFGDGQDPGSADLGPPIFFFLAGVLHIYIYIYMHILDCIIYLGFIRRTD